MTNQGISTQLNGKRNGIIHNETHLPTSELNQHLDEAPDFKTTLAGIAGNILEYYDFTIFTAFSDVIAEKFFAPNQKGNAALIETFAVFGMAFIARPIGGLIIGKMGDTSGHKGALETSVFWMAFSTFGMGCLPSYEMVGDLAPILLILMRLIQGLSVGGQLMSSILFTLERSPVSTWGWKGSTVFGAISVGVSIGSVFATIIRDSLTQEQVEVWGWRIAFYFGAFGALPALYLKFRIKEVQISYSSSNNQLNSGGDEGNVGTTSEVKDPVRETLKKSNRRALLATILSPTCNSVVYYLLFVWLVVFMNTILEPPIPHAFTINSINGILGGILLTLFGGWFADWVGDYVKVMLISAAILTVASPFAFTLFETGGEYVGVVAFFIQLILSIFLGTYLGAMVPWLVLITPPKIRLTSLSLGYNIALSVWGGFTPLIATVLVDQFNKIGAGYFISLAGIMGIIGVWVGPKKYYLPRSDLQNENNLDDEDPSKPLLD